MTDHLRVQLIRYESVQEPRDDEERALMADDAWDWDTPVDVVLAENPSVGMSIELTLDEHRTLGKSARAASMTTHAFIKQAALAAARRTSPNSLPVMSLLR